MRKVSDRSKTELTKARITFIEYHDTAVKKHNAFVDAVPNISEGRLDTCQSWLHQFKTEHQAIIKDIKEHLASRLIEQSNASSSKYSSTLSKFKETVNQLSKQFHEVWQQLKELTKTVETSGENLASKIPPEIEVDKLIERIKKRWRGFTGNRIGRIHRNTDLYQWRHVPGVGNPADACSRGIDPTNAEELARFHQGTTFLQHDLAIGPTLNPREEEENKWLAVWW